LEITFPENNVPENKFPEKNVYTTFAVDFVSRSIGEKFEFLFSKVYHRIAKKSDRILQKKLLKNLS
jgi:hypothetical protein